jgi:Flp pilus assembly protein TadG
MSRSGSDDGSMAIEMVAYIPTLVIAGLVAMQLFLAALCATQTSGAVRDAARAQSLGQDPAAAAEHALTGFLRAGLQPVTVQDGVVSVDVRIPLLLTGLTVEQFTVHRQAVMPDTTGTAP